MSFLDPITKLNQNFCGVARRLTDVSSSDYSPSGPFTFGSKSLPLKSVLVQNPIAQNPSWFKILSRKIPSGYKIPSRNIPSGCIIHSGCIIPSEIFLLVQNPFAQNIFLVQNPFAKNPFWVQNSLLQKSDPPVYQIFSRDKVQFYS